MAETIARRVRVDPHLLDGPIMDRGGVTYVRLLVKPPKTGAARPLRVFELELTDTSGKKKRERLEVAIFYDASIVVAATFTLRLILDYVDVERGRVEVVYDPSQRRASLRFGVARGTLDVVSEVHGPEVGRTVDYDEFLDAPPEEQRELHVSPEGVVELPPAPSV